MDFSKRIEQILFIPNSSEEQVRRLCMEAKKYNLAAVGLIPAWARLGGLALANSPVRLDIPIGYPLGTHTSSVKGLEARLALEEGAAEITIVPNLADYASGRLEHFQQDLHYVIRQGQLVNPKVRTKVLLYLDLLEGTAMEQVLPLVQTATISAIVLSSCRQPSPFAPALERIKGLVQPGVQVEFMVGPGDLAEAMSLFALGIDRLLTPNGIRLAQEAQMVDSND